MHYCYQRNLQEKEDVIIDTNDIGKIKTGSKMQGKIEASMLVEDMDALECWCQTKNTASTSAFFVFFKDAILSAYCRYIAVKEKAWSSKRNIFMLICSALLPVLSGAVSLWISIQISSTKGTTSFLIGIGLGIIWLVLYLYYKSNQKRAYYETWVRHSVCYARLHLALSAFLISPRSDKEFETFVSSVFAILEQNLDQFALNLSVRGMAPRATKSNIEGATVNVKYHAADCKTN